jgi:hypothetical protein
MSQQSWNTQSQAQRVVRQNQDQVMSRAAQDQAKEADKVDEL